MTVSQPSSQALARITGVIYLILIVAGIYGSVVVRANLIFPGDATTTAQQIMSAEGSFRISIVSDLTMIVADVALAVLFFVLLKQVSYVLALVTTLFRLTQASILGLNLLNLTLALNLLTSSDVAELADSQRHSLAMLFLTAQGIGYDLGLVFFAVSLMALGYVLLRSSRIPKLIIAALILSAGVYLVGSLITILVPNLRSMFEVAYLLPFVAELALAGWLTVRGLRLSEVSDGNVINPQQKRYA
ncbi:MAG: DUF4386 domain-containing protein [Deinococcota bacterium]